MAYIAVHHQEKCKRCGVCVEIVDCPGSAKEICLGCGACVLACPNEAMELVESPREKEVTIEVDGMFAQVPEQISVKDALIGLGYQINALPSESPGGIFAPCDVGGCWSCAMEINGIVKPACRTEVKNGMKIRVEPPKEYIPRRIVEGFLGHPVGGVGTPWRVKGDGTSLVEAACFATGCNFRCPQCQNWILTYKGSGDPLTPGKAAEKLTSTRRELGVNRLLISGGECTLNRPWLVQFIKELRVLNPDKDAHFHVDTNGSLLTHDYIDELVDAGMTDIGIDLKALETSTFMLITGLKDRELAEKYKEIAWEAVYYLAHNYSDKVFVGVGIPYNRALNSITEITHIAARICEIDPFIQVTALNYGPAFRSHITRPEDKEMEAVRTILKGTGLKVVLSQTTQGYVGP